MGANPLSKAQSIRENDSIYKQSESIYRIAGNFGGQIFVVQQY